MPQKLTIKRLSAAGQVIKTVECCRGEVAVFRSSNWEELRSYQLALVDSSGADRFSILLDSQPWAPFEHVLIGFGEHFLDNHASVISWLSEQGLPAGSLGSMLDSYGLKSCAETACSALSPAESRMVHLLAATCAPEDKIVVLNDPFEPLHQSWRDRYAELLSTWARTKQRIVVVAGLSARPECWIDNETIHRIEVGEVRNKTIGFSRDGDQETNQLLAALRSASSPDPSPERAQNLHTDSAQQPVAGQSLSLTRPRPASSTNQHDQQSASGRAPIATERAAFARLFATKSRALSPWIPAGALALVCGVGGVSTVLVLRKDSRIAPVSVAANQQPPESGGPRALAETLRSSAVSDVRQAHENAAQESIAPALASRETAVTLTQTVLEHYPVEIKESVIAAFQGRNVELQQAELLQQDSGSTGVASPAAARSPANPRSDENVFRLLEESSGSQGQGEPSQASQGSPGFKEEQDWEAQREAMRQRFLESLRMTSE